MWTYLVTAVISSGAPVFPAFPVLPLLAAPKQQLTVLVGLLSIRACIQKDCQVWVPATA